MRKPLVTTLKALIAALMLAIALPAVSALADPLDDARAAGILGERPDGYVDVVSGNATPMSRGSRKILVSNDISPTLSASPP